ncbi:hypothetical protein [Caldifermentibacillus hisashii]|uniref:hypothetical protein n=1 Tax=Caldifermentibacillus hisashii TaxID=996558 RepID=UPI0031018F3A
MKKYKHTNIVKSGKELVEGGNMKKVCGIVAIIIVVYAIYFDITTGTLPGAEKKESVQETALSLQYVELEVKPGDTLLSLIESQGGYPDDVSIEEMIKDFSALNEGIKPDDMKFGETYKIPVYNKKSAERPLSDVQTGRLKAQRPVATPA